MLREDVAEACVQAPRRAEALGRTFELRSGPGAPVDDWVVAFAALDPDRPTGGSRAD